jgi:hypothetical protein
MNSRWFSAVKCEARRRTVVMFRAPSASLSRRRGNLLAVRAASIRVGLGFGQPQNLDAVREQRREACAKVEPPSVELSQVGDEMSSGPAFAVGDGRQTGHELGIREMRWNVDTHAAFIHIDGH